MEVPGYIRGQRVRKGRTRRRTVVVEAGANSSLLECEKRLKLGRGGGDMRACAGLLSAALLDIYPGLSIDSAGTCYPPENLCLGFPSLFLSLVPSASNIANLITLPFSSPYQDTHSSGTWPSTTSARNNALLFST